LIGPLPCGMGRLSVPNNPDGGRCLQYTRARGVFKVLARRESPEKIAARKVHWNKALEIVGDSAVFAPMDGPKSKTVGSLCLED
jgi:hypothetical protein